MQDFDAVCDNISPMLPPRQVSKFVSDIKQSHNISPSPTACSERRKKEIENFGQILKLEETFKNYLLQA